MQLKVVKLYVHKIINILLLEKALPLFQIIDPWLIVSNLTDSDHFSKKHILKVKKNVFYDDLDHYLTWHL